MHRPRPSEPDILQAPAQLVISGELIEVGLEAEHAEDSRQQADADRKVAPLQTAERGPGRPHPGGQVSKRHPPTQAGKAEPLAELLSASLC